MSEFISFLHEVFADFGEINTRKMFGGYGVYHQGLMFGLVADDELYLKNDAQTSAIFDQHNLEAFEYSKNDKTVKMSYNQAPEAIFDDPIEANKWATLAFEAALRSASNKKQKKK